jgi:hypothetical protein
MKQCKVCGLNKPLTDYYKNHGKCKPCYLGILKTKRVPGSRKGFYLQKSYGITLEDYNQMLQEQDGRCAICLGDDPKSPERVKHWYVDHCHSTGKVRGLLCNACNRALGNFGDDISNLQRAIEYLQRNQQ